ncbi:KinB signaling pathway activation protein [Salsuginibacillus halophilus]|uniref:KinB signaling pathway activation protein n=1 Tax=Salsuginibacillus halophilus TaxID=517424 RepID=A0A2P8H8V3_9BACI|nr:KinB signaling pathway activation protein [Salsuginibacillus halophilus]
MNTRKVVYLFWTTLLLGATFGMLVGIVIDLDTYLGEGVANFILGAIWMFGISAAISLVAQMGFFAYLTLHRIALSIFKGPKLWNRVQIVLIAFAYFDLVFLRYWAFAEEGESLAGYFITPTLLLLFALAVAYVKQKETNRATFVPALFFMFVITIIEWVPALTIDIVHGTKWLWIYLTPLVVANTWQLLMLHRLYSKDDEGLKPKPGQPAEPTKSSSGKKSKKKKRNKKKK